MRLSVGEDQSTNFDTLAVESGESVPAETADAPAVPSFVVGQVDVSEGEIDFTDLSLPLPFAADVTEIEGRISTLSTVSDEPAVIDLTGRVGEYGLAEISGRIRPSDPTALTDLL